MTAAAEARSQQLCRELAREFRRRMQGEYMPRIRRCVGMLGDALWQRPGGNCNSTGNLLLHLHGNVRQWMLVTFGGEPDRRQRDQEFAADGRGAPPAAELLDQLDLVVARSCDLVDGLDTAELLRSRVVQRQFDETGLGVVLHVLEHFSGHAGQIYAWTKQVTGKDLRHYDL